MTYFSTLYSPWNTIISTTTNLLWKAQRYTWTLCINKLCYLSLDFEMWKSEKVRLLFCLVLPSSTIFSTKKLSLLILKRNFFVHFISFGMVHMSCTNKKNVWKSSSYMWKLGMYCVCTLQSHDEKVTSIWKNWGVYILTDSKEHPIPSHFTVYALNSGVCGIDLSICITCLTQKCHVNYIIFWKIKAYESISLGKVWGM